MNISPTSRTIWLYWDTGFADAPELVRLCAKSWVKRNPDWNVILLDDDNVNKYVNMADVRQRNPKLPIQAFTDLLRLRLLKSYGGIWSDATGYCNRPVSEWLFQHTYDGFFVFKSK